VTTRLRADHDGCAVGSAEPTRQYAISPQRVSRGRTARSGVRHSSRRKSSRPDHFDLIYLRRDFPVVERGFEFGVGINTGYIRGELVAETQIDARYHPMVPGSGIARYGRVTPQDWILYDAGYVRGRGSRGRTLPDERLLSEQKILVVRTRNLSLGRRVVATLDPDSKYNLNRLSNIIARPGYQLLGLLGVLNSRLVNWLFSTRYYDYEIKPVYLRKLPMPECGDGQLIGAVRRMLDLVVQHEAATTNDDQTRLARLISATDTEIDDHVYRLYMLTPEERAIVDGWAPQGAPDERTDEAEEASVVLDEAE
jgi:adenine-specific DNA-methyltransferase